MSLRHDEELTHCVFVCDVGETLVCVIARNCSVFLGILVCYTLHSMRNRLVWSISNDCIPGRRIIHVWITSRFVRDNHCRNVLAFFIQVENEFGSVS